MQQAITFYNFTDKVFSWTWDKVPYTFKPKSRYMMEDWKARHFAKHLANLHCNEQQISVMDPRHEEYMAMALPKEDVVEAEDASKLATDLMNLKEEAKPEAKKKGRPKKVLDEDTFEGYEAPKSE